MQFRDWMDSCPSASPAQMAEKLGVTLKSVYRYLNAERIPDPVVMEKIVTITRGKVTPNDFYGLPKPSRRRTA